MKSKLTIISASNLVHPLTNITVNPIVRIYSHAAGDYYIGETKSVGETNNPLINQTFEFDFLRATYFDFQVFHHRFFLGDQLIAIGQIKATDITSRDAITIPLNCVRSGSIVASLVVSFQFEFFPPKHDTFSFYKKRIFLYTTYTALLTEMNPVDIDCIVVNNEKEEFFKLNSDNWWTLVGRSTCNLTVPVGVGFSQIRMLDVRKLRNYDVHFIIKSNNYTGPVRLHFACLKHEEYGKIKTNNSDFLEFKTIDFNVVPGQEYTAPVKLITKTFGRIDFVPEDSTNDLEYYLANCQRYKERIMMSVHRPSPLNHHRRIALLIGGKIVDQPTMDDLFPKLFVFDRDTKELVLSLNEQYSHSETALDGSIENAGHDTQYEDPGKSLLDKYLDNYCYRLKLDQIPLNYSILLAVRIPGIDIRTVINPFVRIVDSDTGKELYFVPFKPLLFRASGELLFRIEATTEDWEIVPVFEPVMQSVELDFAAQEHYNNDCPQYDETKIEAKPVIVSKEYWMNRERKRQDITFPPFYM